jgi:hypothetical protein
MQNFASTFFSLEPDSSDAGRMAGEHLKQQFGAERLKAVIVYATMNHDHAEMLEALRATLAKDVILLGSSGQGVVGDGELTEEGMVLGAIGFGGEAMHCTAGLEREIQIEPFEKGRALAQKLKSDLGVEPKIVIIYYDPLSGVDVETLIAGMRTVLACELVGAGSGQPRGQPLETAQFWDTEVLSHGVLGLALSGPFATEIGLCNARVLAQRLGRAELSVAIEAGGTRVDPRRFGGLCAPLVRVLRNAVDHGIELPAERLARGKSAQGRISLRASHTARELVLELEDDGRGVDWARVRELAESRGLPHQSANDLVLALLSDGFSTKSRRPSCQGAASVCRPYMSR